MSEEQEQSETDSQVEKPPATQDQRQGDPADEPVVPFQPNPEAAPTSTPENPPQPPEYDVDEEEADEEEQD
jgi:hypothetical protein